MVKGRRRAVRGREMCILGDIGLLACVWMCWCSDSAKGVSSHVSFGSVVILLR